MSRQKPVSLQVMEDLYATYARYNKKYWAGQLPHEVTIMVVATDGKGYAVDLEKGVLGAAILSSEKPMEPLIELSATVMDDKAAWRRVLGHEMCHIAVDLRCLKEGRPPKQQHGPLFKEEVRKRGKMGFLEEII